MNRIPFDLSKLHRFPVVSVDTETSGLHWYLDKLFGVAVAGYDPETKTMMSGYYDIRDKPHVVGQLHKELNGCTLICNHNIKFDAHFLANEGIILPADRIGCTSVRAALINEHEKSFSLDSLGLKYCGVGKVDDIYQKLADLFGGSPTRGVQIKNLHRAPSNLVEPYAKVDAENAILLWLWQEEEIKRQGLERVWDLERRLMPVLLDIERQGVRVDVDRAVSSQIDIDKTIVERQRELNKLAGFDVNAASPKQMQRLFSAAFNTENERWYTGSGYLLESTDAGAASINADALRGMAALGVREAELALSLRKLTKAKSFLKDHILGHELGGRVYPNYNQARSESGLGTGTGRFSVDDPALQQIPARDKEIAAIVRSCFLPEVDCDWSSHDWSQMEFRMFAHYTNDQRLLKVYADNPDADFHQMVAELTGLPRSARFAGDANSKQINLGLVFGMGRGKMAMEMGLDFSVRKGRDGKEWLEPGEAAMAVFDKYHGAIPGVKELLEQASSIARSRGYVKTVMGRHIRFPGGQFVHKAGGLVFQGSSADAMKVKMLEMHSYCKDLGVRMLSSVHDELNFSVPKGLRGTGISAGIAERLNTFDGVNCPIKLKVPITSTAAYGVNWYEASK